MTEQTKQRRSLRDFIDCVRAVIGYDPIRYCIAQAKNKPV